MLTAEQIARRRGKITSSVAAAALGLDRWCSPYGAWAKITGREETQAIDSKAIARGNALEDIVLEHPTTLHDGWAWRHAPYREREPWAGDSCDACYHVDGDLAYIGEGKTVSSMAAGEYGEEGTDEIPERTMIQCQWHLLHWPEVEECLVPVLVGGYSFEFSLYRVRRDVELAGILWDSAHRWHCDHVAADVPPEADERDTALIRARMNVITPGKWAEDTPDLAALVGKKVACATTRKALEAEEEAAANRIRLLLGDAEGARGAWGKVYYKRSKSTAKTDWKAVATSLGATDSDIDRFTTLVPGPRSLRIYGASGGDER
jgi:hypothetical protein